MAFENPLHTYSSYSYHHILVACSNTEIAEQIVSSGQIGKLMRSRGASTQILDGTEDASYVKNDSSGDYIVVINSMHDAEYTIKSAVWSTILAPGDITPSSPSMSSFQVEGTLEIIEPRGFRFLNVLHQVAVKLKTNPIGITWVLKTIFVGHGDNANPIPSYITNIRPFMFMMYDLTGEFDDGGALYTIKLVGTSNGASKIPKVFNTTSGTTTIVPTDQSTLAGALSKLFASVNASYDDSIAQAKQMGAEKKYFENGRLIKWTLELDKVYTKPEYKFDGLSASADSGMNLKNNTIEDAIDNIMLRCKKYLDESTNAGDRHIYRMSSVLLSDNDQLTVKYIINRVKLVESEGNYIDESLYNQLNRDVSGADTPTQAAAPETATVSGDKDYEGLSVSAGEAEVIEFDYLYTGKNVDVISFDIKLTQGLAYFQALSTPSNSTDNAETVVRTGDNVAIPARLAAAATGQSADSGNKKVLVGALSDNRFTNDNVPRSDANYRESMSKHAALESLLAKVKILGNPYLLDNFSTLPSETGQNRSGPGVPNWHSLPALCKVNISMPSNNSLLGVGGVGSSFQVKFWYDGFYKIISIEQSFANGEFTQEIEMLSISHISTGTGDIQESQSVVAPQSSSFLNQFVPNIFTPNNK